MSRPFGPGDVLSGEAALVVDNEEGVKDVKHKLSVASVGVRVFWESSESKQSDGYVARGRVKLSS